MNWTDLILATAVHLEEIVCVDGEDTRKLDSCTAYGLIDILLDMHLWFIISAKSQRLDLVNDGAEVAVKFLK